MNFFLYYFSTMKLLAPNSLIIISSIINNLHSSRIYGNVVKFTLRNIDRLETKADIQLTHVLDGAAGRKKNLFDLDPVPLCTPNVCWV